MKNLIQVHLALFLTISFTSFSCKKEVSGTPQPPVLTQTIPPDADPPAEKKKYNYLALGDSYTIGQNVTENERWSVQLKNMLLNQGLEVQNPDIIARTGWTTANLDAAIKTSNNTKTYHIVSLLIGVNNQYQGRSMAEYRAEFKALLETLVVYAGNNPKNVFVLSIPDWGVTPAGSGSDRNKIASEIDAFNAIAIDESQKAGVVYVDITPLSRTALNDPSMVANDSLHFSGKMYAKWAELALPKAKEILSRQ